MTMNKKKIKIVSFVIAGIAVIVAATIVFQTVIGGLYVQEFDLPETARAYPYQNYDSADLSVFSKTPISIEEFDRVAETEYLVLFVKNDNSAIKLYDKRNGRIWSSSPEEDEILKSATSDAVKKRMSSLFAFNYVDLTNIRAAKKSVNLSEASAVVSRNIIKNGVSLRFEFENLAIKFNVNFTLIGDELYCCIPDKTISENEKTAAKITENKEKIQNKINEFQAMADDFQKKLESSDYDKTVITVIKLFSNEIFNILVKAKETTGTESFDSAQFEYIQSDILEIKDRLNKKSGKLYDMILKMEKEIEDIIKLTSELSDTRAGGITDFDFMPYFGVGRFGDNGYVFYPDGSGAISMLNILHSESGGVYEQDIYDSFSLSRKAESLNPKSSSTVKPALYPVFGVKNGDSAFTAIVSKGDTDAFVHFNPVTNSNAFGNIYAGFYFRQMTSNNNQNGESFSVYDTIRTKQDWEVTYKFSTGEDADYSGMAQIYKEYLKKNNMLTRSSVLDREMPLAAEFVMGMEPPQNSLFRSYIKLTEFNDIKLFSENLSNEGINSLMVNIDAWTKHYGKKTWQALKPAEEIGGYKGIDELTEYFNKKNNIISLTVNLTIFNSKDLPRLIRNNATAKALNKISVNILDQSYLNPFFAYKTSTADLKAFDKFGNNAVTYKDLSNNLYYDYNVNGTAARAQTSAVFNKIISDGKKKVNYSVQTNATALYLSQTDWNIGMDNESAGYLFTDREVPFYQMVIHGYIPYTSSPLNEASDIETAKLKRFEYGEIPFYRLTRELPSEIKLWYNTGLYSPHISKWFSEIVDDYKSYITVYGTLWNKEIISHDEIAENVYCVCYDNGLEVIVNFSETDYKYKEKTIPKQSSLVV